MIRRGIVLVHGVGFQRHGDQLDEVVEALVEFLGWAVGRKQVQLVSRRGPEDSGVASDTIHLYNPGQQPGRDRPVEEWHVREAWWADSFKPADSASILGWCVRIFLTFVRMAIYNLCHPPSSIPEQPGIWRTPNAHGMQFFVERVYRLLLLLLTVLGSGFATLAVLVLYLILLLPFQWLAPEPLAGLLRSVTSLITGQAGDEHAMANRHAAMASAARVVSRALWPFLAPEALRQSGYVYDSVTVVAHSGGCLVSFDALAGEEVRSWVAADPDRKRINWITAGNGLNVAWHMRARKKDRDNAYWERRIDGYVNWIDIYGRYDPVPEGVAPDEMVAEIVGPRDAAKRATEPACPATQPYVSVRVANYDFPITEHGGYWTNFSEVMARIVYVISDSRLRREALDTVRHAHSQPARSPVQEQLFRAIEPGMPRMEKHRRQLVGEVWRYLLAFLLGIGAVAWFGRTLGESVSERLAALPIVPSWLPLGRTDVHWLLGTLVIGYAALMVIGLLRLGGEFRSWLARERDLPNAEESEPEQSIAAPLAQAH